MLNSTVDRLSGGEKRRLYLLTVLMQRPNLLILDEPTNDLDIVTLEILEEYLKDEYKGSLIIVSHDRHFLDRLVDHLLVFTGDGCIKDFIGGYTEYRSFLRDREAEKRPVISSGGAAVVEKSPVRKKKRTWKEEREMEALEAEIEALTAEKAELEESLSSGTLAGDALLAASSRWLELSLV